MKQNELYGQMLGGKANFWTGDMEVEQEALKQITNITNLPILAGPMAVMPDVHYGMGATVGSVIPLNAAVIPAAVGVDIGCGMCAVKTSLKADQLPDSLKDVRSQIERDVPVGFNTHKHAPRFFHEGNEARAIEAQRDALFARFKDLRIMGHITGFEESRLEKQMGTLGGGNHFIELCVDTEQNVWIMLHSGSRNIGKTIGERATEMARDRSRVLGIELADRDLAWFEEGTEEFDMYVEGMSWAQEYARLNRDFMLTLVLRALRRKLPAFTLTEQAINCHHNYLSKEVHDGRSMYVTRKGAVSAQKGELGIIPGSMGAKSFIVCGKGHTSAYCSCSHGAGRRMSRGKAKREISMEDFHKQVAGVECRTDEGVLDEAPAAYKDIDAVMEAQKELVDVKAVLKQVMCIKG
jgi:tRNA-splicing ligase RtcB